MKRAIGEEVIVATTDRLVLHGGGAGEQGPESETSRNAANEDSTFEGMVESRV